LFTLGLQSLPEAFEGEAFSEVFFVGELSFILFLSVVSLVVSDVVWDSEASPFVAFPA
jgi:hypothetical protein